MTRPVNRFTQTTAIALGLMLTQGGAFAQPYSDLSGVDIAACEDAATKTDAGTLGPEAFNEDDSIKPQFVVKAVRRDEVCIDAEGVLKFSGKSGERVAPELRLAGEGANQGMTAAAEAEAGAEAEAMTDAQGRGDGVSAEAETEMTADTEAETDMTADTEAEAEAPDVIADTAADAPAADQPVTAEAGGETADTATAADLQAQLEATADSGAEGEQPITAESQADAGADMSADQPIDSTGRPADETAEAPMQDDAIADEPPAALAAEAEGDGRDAEPADVTETTVTEETSRSSTEEFANNVQGDAAAQNSGSERSGLSNFEKFALGAAGIVALDAILGQNREVVSNSGDRVVIRDSSGDLEVLRDDDTLLRRPGADVRTETFSDGSTRTTVTRPDGTRVVTIADAAGRVVKRTRYTHDGREIIIIDDTEDVRPVDVTRLPQPAPRRESFDSRDRESLEAALRAQSRADVNRSFTLRQVREYREVRELMPEISIDAINFATASAAIQPQEAEELFELGEAMRDFIAENPDELFMVEGHTDAVGDAAYNLALSDRRAESVALALTEYFDVPPENMIIQGYGESHLLVPTQQAERANRRAVVRRITPLLR